MDLSRIASLTLGIVLEPLRLLEALSTAGSLANARLQIEESERRRALLEALELAPGPTDRVA